MSRLAGVALPVAAALLASGAVLLAVGVDPLAYYGIVVRHGLLTPLGLAESAIRSAPLLLLAASLMVSFSAGLWNLGGDGQFLLAAVAVSAICPPLDALAGPWVALPAGLLVSLFAGGLWAALPAFLRAWRGVNEIITTLMMSFLGASLANALIKLVFLDPETTVPRTRLLPVADRLPRLFGGTVHLGVPLAVLVLVGVQLALARTAWGLRLRALGASRRAAGHAGIDVPRTSFAALVVSGGLAGLAGGVDILGVWGGVRADWNPGFGLSVVALVCLARLNGWAVAALVPLFAVLSVGGESAAIRLGVPSSFSLVFVALMLLFLALSEALGRARRRA
jgi:simple sugar transport system permease protein